MKVKHLYSKLPARVFGSTEVVALASLEMSLVLPSFNREIAIFLYLCSVVLCLYLCSVVYKVMIQMLFLLRKTSMVSGSCSLFHRKINDYVGFKQAIETAKNIAVITGAGVSQESGIPVFRGAGGLWREYDCATLATPEAFRADPSLVWEFYHYRRCVAFHANPNWAHITSANFEKDCLAKGRGFHIITQNVDGLHQRAGSTNVIELHGSLRKIRCTSCGVVDENTDDPICEALRDRGDPEKNNKDLPKIPVDDLPKCKQCGKLTRPHIVWFGENLEITVINKANDIVDKCDFCLVIGTSSVVYPAALFAKSVADRGGSVAEFNLNPEPAKSNFRFHFQGPCGVTLRKALGYDK